MILSDLRKKISADDLLNALGLEPRRSRVESVASATGLLGAGILIGVGIAMLLSARNEAQLGGVGRGQIGGVQPEGAQPLTQM